MLQKIRGVMTVRDEMDSLKTEVLDLKDLMKRTRQDLLLEAKRLIDIRDQQSEYLSHFLQATQSLSRLREEINKELDQFRILNRSTHSRLTEKFEMELTKSFRNQTGELEAEKRKYKDLRMSIEEQAETLTHLSKEITRLQQISQKISTSDFELTQTHQRLNEENQHKLQLMKRIDDLERMIARMKRR